MLNMNKSTAEPIENKYEVNGYEDFKKLISQIFKEEEDTPVYVYFVGEPDDSGTSWCPDCRIADPVLKEALEQYAPRDAIFVEVIVGDRPTWKDMKNPFRVDSEIRLEEIPTLIRWKSVVRLNGLQCAKMPLLEMFFLQSKED